VRHRLEAEVAVDARHDVDRLLARRAAGAVGDGDERGRERHELLQRGLEVDLALLGLRREELEREDGLVARPQQLADAHQGRIERHTSDYPSPAVS
jgi:hypothetical protein